MSRPISHEYSLNGITIIELLVNRDGRVQKMAVVSSSGDAATDQMAMSMYRNARYSLTLTPDAPAPYVVREIVVFKDVAAKVHPSIPDNSSPHTTYTEGYTTGTVAGFVK
jgi:TonB family protein